MHLPLKPRTSEGGACLASLAEMRATEVPEIRPGVMLLAADVCVDAVETDSSPCMRLWTRCLYFTHFWLPDNASLGVAIYVWEQPGHARRP